MKSQGKTIPQNTADQQKGRNNNKNGFTAETKYTSLNKQYLPGTKIRL